MVTTNCAKSLITAKEGTFGNFLNGKQSIFKGCWLFFLTRDHIRHAYKLNVTHTN